MSDRRLSMMALGTLMLPHMALLAAAPQSDVQDEPFQYSADTSDVSFRTDTAELLGNVRVIQGANSIEAEQATVNAFRSENSRWEFQNSVRVRTADADLMSEVASAAFENDELVGARVEGSPAQFERRGGSPERLARGRADVIEYDVTADTIKLTGGVWFGYGKDEFRGDTVLYSIRDERVQVNPGGDSPGGRVKGIIRPRSSDAEPTQPQTEDAPAPLDEAATPKSSAAESGA